MRSNEMTNGVPKYIFGDRVKILKRTKLFADNSCADRNATVVKSTIQNYLVDHVIPALILYSLHVDNIGDCAWFEENELEYIDAP